MGHDGEEYTGAVKLFLGRCLKTTEPRCGHGQALGRSLNVPSTDKKLGYKMTTRSRRTFSECKKRCVRFIPHISRCESFLENVKGEGGSSLKKKIGRFPPRPMMCQLPVYQDLLRIGETRKGAIFLDIGSGGKNRMNLSPQNQNNP
jgi:hypothetical protein